MDDHELRALLARVKAGELSPEDAAAALGREHEHDGQPETPDPDAPTADVTDFSGVRVVRLRATANRTKVIADPSVRTVRVDGPHRLRIDGHRLIVENEIGDEQEDRVGEDGPHIRIRGLRAGRGGKIGFGRHGFSGHDSLEVRVNPTMPVDFDCDAGVIEVLGLAADLTGRINAGDAVIEDFDGPLHLSVNAGRLRANGRLDGGESSIDVNVGKADVVLETGSNVRIIRSATLGSAEADDDVVGTGEGTLRVTCSLGAVRVHSSKSSSARRAGHV